MNKISVLFLCIHNSARSQMAESYMKKLAPEKFEPESAGVEAGMLNPLAIEVMKEDGIDISGNSTKKAFDFYKQGKTFYYVITVCDPKTAEQCPIFPKVYKVINWNFADPSAFTGTREEKLQQTRAVRDQIKAAVQKFIDEVSISKG